MVPECIWHSIHVVVRVQLTGIGLSSTMNGGHQACSLPALLPLSIPPTLEKCKQSHATYYINIFLFRKSVCRFKQYWQKLFFLVKLKPFNYLRMFILFYPTWFQIEIICTVPNPTQNCQLSQYQDGLVLHNQTWSEISRQNLSDRESQ